MKRFFLLLLILLISIEAVNAKSYFISDAVIDATVLDNGLVNIRETRTYDFSGCFSMIYRTIPLYKDSSITNFMGSSPESFTEVRRSSSDEFYYEFNFNQAQCDKRVTVVFDYQMSKIVNSYDDLSELHFMFWGAQEPNTERVSFYLTLPGGVIDYWVHPFYEVSKEQSSINNTVSVTVSNLQEGRWVEARVLFSGLSAISNTNLIGGAGLSKIRSDEEGFASNNFFAALINYLLFLIPIIPIIIFVYIYYKQGIEPKVEYSNKYEREPPSKDSPSIVNAILNSDRGAIPNIDAFIATIFDLVTRGYVSVSQVTYSEGKKQVDDVMFKLINTDTKGLNDYESDVISFLKEHAEFQKSENRIYWKKLDKKLKNVDYGLKFNTFFREWSDKVANKVNEKDYFVSKGRDSFIKFGVAYLFFSFLSLFGALYFTDSLNGQGFYIAPLNLFASLILNFIVTIILLMIPPIVLGRRTREGTFYYLKWMSFKRFLKDFSLLKEHAPESVKIWEHFMVYAIALGVAEYVIKVMKLFVPEESKSGFTVFYSYPYMFDTFHSSFYNSSVTSRKSSSGGSGGSYGGSFGGGGYGGGFGGGGSGAR